MDQFEIKTNASKYSRKFSEGQMIFEWIVLFVILLIIIVPLIFL